MARSAAVDALEKFRFIVEFLPSAGTGEPTTLDRAGFYEVAMPKRSTNKIQYREGDDRDIFSLSAGLSSMEDVVLTRGVIPFSPGKNALYEWMTTVHNPSSGNAGPSIKGAASSRPSDAANNLYRKDIRISVLDRSGNRARVYDLYQCWVSNYVPGSDLNAGEDGDKLLESITLCYEDFMERVANQADHPAAPISSAY